MVVRRDHPLSNTDPQRARPRHRRARRHRGAGRRHRDHHPQVRHFRQHSEDAIEEAKRLGGAVKEQDLARPHRLPADHDGDDRRRARPRLRRRDHDRDGCRTATTGSACTSRTSRTTCPKAARSTRKRTSASTSVYFPERAVHMFPSELSTGLCSLNPNVDRLVQSCLMEIDRSGNVVRYEIHDGVIHSDARMTYTDVNAILTDRDPALIKRYAPLVPHVRDDARAVRDPEQAPPAARLDRLRPEGAGDRPRRRGAGRSRSSRSSGTSPTG